jgi:4-cresol dehydrogenase (hydroxylating) flavoprotein subunit
MSICTAPAPLDSREIAADTSSAALREWAEVLGREHVQVADAVRDRYARTTGAAGRRPAAVLYPSSTAEVQQVMRIASKYGVTVHPISKGKNWGYGDANPPREGQVILDLGRMNRIIEVNEESAYAVIEPGVTQGQLYAYLAEHEVPLWMDASGAGLDASIVGNVLDRGFGHTRYGDRFLNTCGLEVVLADGSLVNTGFTHYANAKSARTYRYGVGPSLDGLFTQSSYGIVTRMGVWLMPAPEDFSAYFISGASESDLEGILNRLAPLRMQGLLQTTIHIGNDLRAISGKMRYPWERTGGVTPLPADVRAAIRRENGMGMWNACGAIYGARETVKAMRKVLRRAMKPYKVTFINDRTVRLAEKLVELVKPLGLLRSLGEKIRVVKPIYGLLKGVPTDEPLNGAAWRVRGELPATPADPLDNHAGLMWLAPTCPATGAAARDLMTHLEPVYTKHGFETLVTFTMITERALCCVTNVAFDRRVYDEAARAKACYEELSDLLMRTGYVPYRVAPSAVDKLSRGSTGFWPLTARIKDALDPQGIISQGRYQPAAKAA